MSIVPFYILIFAIYIIIKQKKKNLKKKFSILNPKRFFRYLKLIINFKIIICITIFSIISNSITLFQNSKYENLYKDNEEINCEAVVISNKKEKEYNQIYKIKIKNTYLYLKVDKKLKKELCYGDKVNLIATFNEANHKRNEGGFDYKNYLKSLKIYGTVKAEKIEIISHRKDDTLINKLTNKVKENIEKILPEKEAGLLNGLLIGDTKKIDDDIQESFKISSLTHVLAVSGMQVTYIITVIYAIFNKRLNKKIIGSISIFILVIYTAMTGFSPSIVRASIMGIIVIIAEMSYRKSDILNTIALSLIIMLIYNPFLITNVGLQLSYLGTIGIIIFYKPILEIFDNIKIKNKKWKYKINLQSKNFKKIKEAVALILSAQIAILPIMIYTFNLIGTYFLLTNLLASILIAPITIMGATLVGISFISWQISKILSLSLKFLIDLLIIVSKFSELPFSKLYIPTPKVWMIIIIYVNMYIIFKIIQIYNAKRISITQKRVKNIIALFKYKIRRSKKNLRKIVVVIIIIFSIIFFIPKDLKINFIDVGQGDATFIITPDNQTILIDGGGSNSKDFDIGQNTMLPYILDKGYNKIDYVIISHFDNDHCGGLLYIMQEIKIGKILIGKQWEDCDNYKKFIQLVKDKKIKVNILEAEDNFYIGKNLKLEIIWPYSKNVIESNAINNNSLVFKLIYKNFSMMFTGDIEEIAEKAIIDKYQNKLKANILKIAHHGSKTSSTLDFLNATNPKTAIIGVGKNNKFGHPSDITIDNLEKKKIKIYRTDINGEIKIRTNGIKTKITTLY